MKYFGQFFRSHWRIILLCGAVAVGLIFLLGYRLGRLTNGLSLLEVQNLHSYSSFHAILANPLNAPYKLVGWVIEHLVAPSSAASVRLTSAVFGLATLVPFSYIVQRWYGLRAAIFGVILFATSSWFLHVSRVSQLDVEFLWASTTIVALHVLLHAHGDKFFVRLVWCIGMIVMIFIPGMVWLVLLNAILQREDIVDSCRDTKKVWSRIALPAVLILGVGLLAVAILRQPHTVLPWLGAPEHITSWPDVPKRFGDAFAYFVLRGPNNAVVWLGRLPILDAFTSVMLVGGLLFYIRHAQAPRTRLLAGFFVVGALLSAFNISVHFSMLVPLVYLVATAGIAYVLHEWLRIFPRNPLARGVGIAVVAVLIVAAGLYNIRSYFVAWPHTPATRAAFTETITAK